VAALHSFGVKGQKNLLLIAGGQSKGQDFDRLKSPLSDFVKLTLLLGEDARQIEQAIVGCGDLITVDSIELAVQAAHQVAVPGDIVLLSPACASFDMFTGFEHRGQCFQQAVTALLGKSQGVANEL
jgi:UDP-N-acetylmuramoylalanine--D-glutamate ligase